MGCIVIHIIKMVFLWFLLSSILALNGIHGFVKSFIDHSECPSDLNEPWTYEYKLANGQHYWGEKYPTCYGHLQSPIAIKDQYKTIYSKYLKPLNLFNYDKPVTKALIENNGHTIKIIPNDGVFRSFLVNSPFTYKEETKFTLDQVHIHFGYRYNSGTEHSIHNQKYAMEMHFVHSDKDRKMAVIAVLYQRVQEDNEALRVLTDNLKSVTYKGEQITVEEALHLDQLVHNGSSYFRYNGSLTTPPCTEGVSWTISREIHKLGMNQWDELKKLQRTEKKNLQKHIKYEGCMLAGNHRDEQPRYDRSVFTSVSPHDDDEIYPWN